MDATQKHDELRSCDFCACYSSYHCQEQEFILSVDYETNRKVCSSYFSWFLEILLWCWEISQLKQANRTGLTDCEYCRNRKEPSRPTSHRGSSIPDEQKKRTLFGSLPREEIFESWVSLDKSFSMVLVLSLKNILPLVANWSRFHWSDRSRYVK